MASTGTSAASTACSAVEYELELLARRILRLVYSAESGGRDASLTHTPGNAVTEDTRPPPNNRPRHHRYEILVHR